MFRTFFVALFIVAAAATTSIVDTNPAICSGDLIGEVREVGIFGRAEDKSERAGRDAKNAAHKAKAKSGNAADKINANAKIAGNNAINAATKAGDKIEAGAESVGNSAKAGGKKTKNFFQRLFS